MKSKVKSQSSKVQKFKNADFAFTFGLSTILLIFEF